jgi:hypothetical protein
MAPMQRAAVLSLPLALVAASLAGCGLLGDSSRLDDALEVVPATADRVTFVDRAAIAERFEVDDVEPGASEGEIDDYLETAREFPAGTEFARYLGVMGDAPFSDLDVEWEVTIGEGDEGFAQVWKMRDDLDLDDVGDELVDLGFEEQDADGDSRSLSVDLAEIAPAEPYLVAVREVTIVPDEHLMIAGPDADGVLEVVKDDADSAVDSERFEDLVDGTDDIEVADLARGEAACSSPEQPLTPERLESSGLEELGSPEQRGFFVHGEDGETRAVLRFADEDAAEDDAEAREAFLDEGTSPISGVPYSEFGDWTVEADGEQVRIDIDYDEPESIPAVIGRGDYPSICAPS